MSHFYLNGFLLTLSLIVAIGAQNAYILKVGICRQHVLIVVLFAIFFDVILIGSGIFGVALLAKKSDLLIHILRITGAAFLLFYSAFSFYKVFSKRALILDGVANVSIKKSLALLAAFTFLNPHSYLDTVVLIGSLGATFSQDAHRVYFFFGAISASIVWFFSLGFGAGFLSFAFEKPITWKILDAIIGTFMLYLAAGIIKIYF
ncbi:MAG: LysE/ArgO family amino acid transporter [Helicobacteraceae bacterium]